ncbi:MAG: acetolactate synthase large subunit [Myxococcota bacterium]
MKAAELLVRCLENEGIEIIFGVPGEENADMMLALEGSSIRFVLTRQEQGAAFMADVYGRLTGNPAGALSTLGPGASNLITGVANANLDRSPMVVLTGQGESTRQHKESHQIMDVIGMFEPVTKWSQTIRHPDAIPELVRKAVRLARMEKPGAVMLELAEDIAKHEVELEPMSVHRFERPRPSDAALGRAVSCLRGAKRPIIIAGNGTLRKNASDALRRLCAETKIGAISTFMGKGVVDVDSPQCLYTIGLQSKDHTAIAVENSDLVIAVGYDMVEYPPTLWNAVAGQRKILHIDFEQAEIDSHYHPDVELIGDIAGSLELLLKRLQAEGIPRYDLDYQHRTREKMQQELKEHHDDTDHIPVRPQKILWDLREALGPDDIVLSDVGAHKMWVARHYHCHQPNTCLIPNGFCSMGFALPGAIAAKMVHPDRNVVAVCGDGGFLMNVQEMETARRLETAVVVLVWEDFGYGLIEWKQEAEFGQHSDLAFGNPDWVQLAESFGWHGKRVEASSGVLPAITEALSQNGPTLIAIPVDYRENLKLTERLGNIRGSL